MTITVIGAILLFSFGQVLSQFDAMYLSPNLAEVSYDKAREEILNNFYNNKPLLNYIPVYNTDYGQWNGHNQSLQEVPPQPTTTQYSSPFKTYPGATIQKLGQDISRLTADVQALSQKAKTAYDSKVKELTEVKKLSEDLKEALQTAEVLKNGLREEEKMLSKSLQNGYPVTNPSGLEQFLKMMEGLETTVRNANCKFEGKSVT